MTSPSTLRDRGGVAYLHPVPSSDEFDLIADLRKELEELSATNREILQELRSDGDVQIADRATELTPRADRSHLPPPVSEEAWVERQREYEALLDEKSEVIRSLHLQIQRLQGGESPGEQPEVDVYDAALERQRAELAQRRRQLEEDEEALTRQIRDMELALARDRAEIARQRSELQRMQADFQRELDTASRDPQLRDRLSSLQRRNHEVGKRPATEPPAPQQPSQSQVPSQSRSSIFRRIFG